MTCYYGSSKFLWLTSFVAVSHILFGWQPALAQNSRADAYFETLAQADAKLSAKQWTEAAALLEQVVRINPVEGTSWIRLGRAYYNANDYRKSIPAYEKQLELGSGIPANAAYNIACDYALLGEKESAIRWLEKAFAMGFTNLPNAQTDADLESLRDDSRYRNLVGLIDTSKMSREEGWRSDLQLLNREIKRRGYHLFPRTGTEGDFDTAVKNLRDSIPQLTDSQVIVELAKLMRRVGDGHTGLLGGLRAEFLQNLPVQFYLFEEGLFIISADPKYKDLIGSQILKFGNRTPDEIVKGLEPIINRDNEIWIKEVAPYRMRNLSLLNALGLIPDAGKVSLTIRGLDGKERIVSLATDPTQFNIWNVKPKTWPTLAQTLPGPAPLYLKSPETAYWFEYLPDNKTVYFGFNSIANDPKESLADFTSRLFRFINEKDVEKLVIDLRWNNGGNTTLLTPIVQGLIKNERINHRGKLFVVIGRRTFSAAQNAATFIERYTNAIFVGEPTGSSPNFVGEEHPFTLPYSKLVVNVSDLYWESAFPQDRRVWIAPQIYLPPTFEAYRTNRDTALEAIISYKAKTN
jgi:tetratricopeptide (TPR) repeat protein